MTEKDKLTLRKPLAPKGDDAECKAAYEELLKSPLGEANLVDSAVEICSELDRLLVEKIWPAKAKQQEKRQIRESERTYRKQLERMEEY